MKTLTWGSVDARPHHASIMPFVLMTFAFSWAVWIGTWLVAGRPDTLRSTPMLVAVYLGSFGPGLAGAVIAARGRVLRAYLAGFLHWRIGLRAVAAIALALPLAVLALTLALGYHPVPQAGVPPVLFYLTLFPASVLNGAVTAVLGAGPLGEEGGWRGTLLPRLLEQMGEMRASLVLGLIWTAWHLPIMAMLPDWRDGLPFGFYLPVYTLAVLGLSVLMTRVWLLSGRSTLAAVWMHGVINAVGGLAFNAKAWQSVWTQQTAMLHFVVAIWLAAAILLLLRARRSSPRG